MAIIEISPFIRKVVREVIAEVEAANPKLGNGWLAYSEAEAADSLGINSHVLRDARRRGEIGFTRIAGRRIRYTREDLLAYLPKSAKR